MAERRHADDRSRRTLSVPKSAAPQRAAKQLTLSLPPHRRVVVESVHQVPGPPAPNPAKFAGKSQCESTP
jgi:hypothetical protein